MQIHKIWSYIIGLEKKYRVIKNNEQPRVYLMLFTLRYAAFGILPGAS